MYELDQEEFENNRAESLDILHSLGPVCVSIFYYFLDIKIYCIALNIKRLNIGILKETISYGNWASVMARY